MPFHALPLGTCPRRQLLTSSASGEVSGLSAGAKEFTPGGPGAGAGAGGKAQLPIDKKDDEVSFRGVRLNTVM